MARRTSRLTLLVAGMASLIAPPLASAADTAVADRVQALVPAIEAYAEAGMALFDLPGLAIGIVADDTLVYAKGFGKRSKSAEGLVDTRTIFQIGSLAKAFLAATQAIMVDRGALRWDDRVVDLYPSFQMKDPWVTREFRVFDLLAQRSGMPPLANDLVIMLGFDADRAIASLKDVEPVTSFRSSFAYTNITHLLASCIVAEAAGAATWNEVLQRELLDPLGMGETTYSPESIAAAPNHAVGHRWSPDGTVEVSAFSQAFPYRLEGAGNINSNIEDMARWVRMQLGTGTFEGKVIVPAEGLTRMRRPMVAVADNITYATGWMTLDTPEGHIVWHEGDALSFGSFIGMVPDQNFGVVVLSNETNVSFPPSFGFWVLRQILGSPEIDLVANGHADAVANFEAARKALERPASAQPAPPPDSLVGDFVHPSMGRATVRQTGGGLSMMFQATGAELSLEPVDGATFRYALVPAGEFGPLAELDYMTRGLAAFYPGEGPGFDRLRLSTQDHQAFEFRRE
ncbi:serine hydrolase domain-containing protein [Acuticoccus kandeliae]|uniref:serine hydrolase domain-containing protein n=1 Tax=Acuticoccus kandeliae TaxID=2073160 RepID=UPI0013002041|nr:serine hydrolase domain-containing protein [Acuticoccus kandeliae]